MVFDVEILLRQHEHVFSERLTHDREPRDWTPTDVEAVLKKMLRAVDGAMSARSEEERQVSLRGLSWIVSPYRDGVVIAFEIDSASVVAGPFGIDRDHLERLVARAVQGSEPPALIH